MKEDNDSAEPAASSIGALNLARLGAMRSDAQLLTRAKQTISAFASQLTNFPSALPQMLVAVDFLQGSPRQIVIAGAKDDQRTHSLRAEVRRHFLPRSIHLLADGGAGQKFLSETNAALLAMKKALSESNEFCATATSTRTEAARVSEMNAMMRTIHKTLINTIPRLFIACSPTESSTRRPQSGPVPQTEAPLSTR